VRILRKEKRGTLDFAPHGRGKKKKEGGEGGLRRQIYKDRRNAVDVTAKKEKGRRETRSPLPGATTTKGGEEGEERATSGQPWEIISAGRKGKARGSNLFSH